MKFNNTIKKLSLVKKFISSHLFAIFLKNLPPTTYHLKPSSRHLPPKKLQAKKLLQSGFTLIELLVTLSLFVALTIVVIFSQSKFNGSILLTNLAYDVALTVRQAQSYGVNVRETVAGSGEFKNAYGVHFEKASDKQFILFADSVGGDGKYYSGTDDSIVNTYKIKRGSYISGICVSFSGVSDPDCNIKKLDITFLRPNPDAIIKCETCSDDGSEAKITISSVDDKERTVIINETGQISVDR